MRLPGERRKKGENEMTKEETKRRIDKHIRSTKGVTRAPGKMKGHKEAAWLEVLAFQKIMDANKE